MGNAVQMGSPMIGDTSLYVWGAYVMGLALALTEIVLLRFRDKAIRGHLGWLGGRRRSRAAQKAAANPSSPGGKT